MLFGKPGLGRFIECVRISIKTDPFAIADFEDVDRTDEFGDRINLVKVLHYGFFIGDGNIKTPEVLVFSEQLFDIFNLFQGKKFIPSVAQAFPEELFLEVCFRKRVAYGQADQAIHFLHVRF